MVEETALARIPATYAISRRLIPVRLRGNTLTVATADPLAIRESVAELQAFLSLEVSLVLAIPLDLNDVLSRLYGGRSSRVISQRIEFATATTIKVAPTARLELNHPEVLQNTVLLVDTILQTAFDRRASDIHFEPHEKAGDVRIRIDGVLHLIAQLPTATILSCISRLKVLGRMDIVEKRLPQDGRMKVRSVDGRELDSRLSTMPGAGGGKLVMRILSNTSVKTLEDLGFYEDERTLWDRMSNHPHGVILVTGLTGSGKTTTLYSGLGALAKPSINISTVEDPVEMIDSRLNQFQINPSIGFTFPVGIRALLRQDSDIMMVGEIRDAESAEVAVQAALTGHLVLATIHTNDAPSTITRLLDLNIPPYLIKAAVVGIVAQRLVRKLCNSCKTPVQASANEWRFLTSPLREKSSDVWYEPRGCDQCNGIGFRGRTGIYELLYLLEPIQRLITPAADTAIIRRVSLQLGMRPLRVSGALRVRDGITTVQEVLHVIPPELEQA